MEHVFELLKRYSEENGTILRSTSDLSPMELWLITLILQERLSHLSESKELNN